MLGGILVLLISGLVSFVIIDSLKKRYPFLDTSLLKKLFFYHILLSLAYYGYAQFNSSDSVYYYNKVIYNFRGDTWGSFYGTSTKFIEFIAYPFIRFLGFSYEAAMALYSFFGFLGFVYFYVFFSENLRFKHKLMGWDLLTITFFLPNLHFWSGSFGKGAVIFLGLGLFFYGVSKIKERVVALVIAGVIIYHVRPHIMLVVLVSTAIGFVFSTKGVKPVWRWTFLTGAIVAFFFIYRDVLTQVGIDEGEVLTQSFDFTHRASELGKATSGIDISNYSLPMQVFTFLYRPLFFDAPGMLGIAVSFENVFYLVVTLMVFGKLRGWKYLLTSGPLVKGAILSFLTVSIALAQVSGNLGLAMRQKSQVTILLMFVVISFMDSQKYQAWLIQKRRKSILDAQKAKAQQTQSGLTPTT
jgi:hypothetical protein